MKGRNIYLVVFGVGAAVMGCKKTYAPKVVANDTNLLVVEGVIDPGIDSTFIKLSHTVKLSEKTSIKPETGAKVTVEGDGVSYNLTEISNGTYATAGLNLNRTKKYHLKIHTSNGQEYLSDDVEVKVTPPIDSLDYKIEGEGLHLYSATHDPTNKTRYYRWDYQETWRFNSIYESGYKVAKDTVIPRVLPQDDIYRCYGSYQASAILLGSTVKSDQDILTNNPVTQITRGTERLSIRYSIKLNQYALTREAYAFWENMKKNTEQLGSIFDALPSEIGGNIHNTADAKIPVIGFVSISTTQSKRIYINRTDLPSTPEWRNQYPYEGCGTSTAVYESILGNTVRAYIIDIQEINYPIAAIIRKNPRTGLDEIAGFTYSTRGCVDCTLRGSPHRPAFWTDN
nr:DUF4249 domain-containing protein [uncultured Mucilaginibacter sp.]